MTELQVLRRDLAVCQSLVLELRCKSIFTTLIEATLANDLARFQSVCDEDMRSAITPDMLLKVSTTLNASLQGGTFVTPPPLAMRLNGMDLLLYVIRPSVGANEISSSRCRSWMASAPASS